jgi:hypothetical protein
MIRIHRRASLLAQLREESFGIGISRRMSSEVMKTRPGPLRGYEAWASNFSWRGLFGSAIIWQCQGRGIEPSCKRLDSGQGMMVPACGGGRNGAAAGSRRLGLGERHGAGGPTEGEQTWAPPQREQKQVH